MAKTAIKATVIVMDAESIADSLGRYTRNAGGGYMACCPAHEDRNPSLSIDVVDGNLLLHCFAGCVQSEVFSAVKAKTSHLWPEFAKSTKSVTKSPAKRKVWQPIYPVPADAEPPLKKHYRHGIPTAVWSYKTFDGELLQLVCRFDNAEGKQVLPLTYCCCGDLRQWRWQALPAPRPLYGLEFIGDAKQILVVEGEKTADAARRLIGPKIPVVTWSGGSNAVSKANWKVLVGKMATVWPDADKAGAKAAFAISTELEKIGATVQIVEPPKGVAQSWDLADAEQEGWSRARVLEKLEAWISPNEFNQSCLFDATADRTSPYAYASLTTELCELDIKIEYLVEGLIPEGMITLFYAPSGMGKSTLASQLCQAVQDGSPFLGLATLKRPVFYLDYENPLPTIVDRLRKIRGTEPFRLWHCGSGTPPPQIDLEQAREQLFEITPGTLLVIDTLKASNNAVENKSEEMKPLFDLFKDLRQRGLTIILLHHTSKGPDGTYRGSSVIQDQSDHCLSLTKSKPQKARVVDAIATYRLGVDGKTRAKPFEMFLAFDRENELFAAAEDLTQKHIELITVAIKEILDRGGEPNQKSIINELKRTSGLKERNVRKLLDDNVGISWSVRSGRSNAKIFSPLS